MKMRVAGGGVVPLPTVEEPLPEYLGTPGLLLLRRLIRDHWKEADRLKLSDEQWQVIGEIVAALDRLMVPAKPAEIGRMLEALMYHYPAVPRLPEAAASIAADWLRDLGHLPADIVDAACTAWRRGQNAYAPTPGHLLSLADPILISRRHLHSMSARILALEGARNEVRNVPPVGSVKAAVGGAS